MKKVIKILFRSASFILAFFIMLNVFSYVFTPKDGMEHGSIYGVDSYKAEDKNTIDIFFIGNSNIASAVAPPVIWSETGYSSCVSGKPNQSVHGAYKAVKDMYKRQNPSVVVIETDMIFAGEGKHFNKEYFLDLSKNVKRIADILIKNFEDAAISGMSYYYPVFKHHERWDELNKTDITETEKRCKSMYRGYNADFHVNPYADGFDYMNKQTDDSKFTEKRAKEMKKIINLCKSKGSKVVLVDVPCASSWSPVRHELTAKFAKEVGLDYIDMNVTVPEGFDWQLHTRDGGTHLNTFGAKLISEYLCDYLKNSVLSDSDIKANADKTVWNGISANFNKEYEENLKEIKI